MEKEPNYQHFRLKHEESGEVIEIHYGPTPISFWNQKNGYIAAMEAVGKDPRGPWNIEKAWVGPKNSTVSKSGRLERTEEGRS